jgi:dihydrofolate synthase/folylpolyglutamate synthase
LVDDPLAYLFGLEQFGIKFGLDNIRAIVTALGHPETAFRSVHVAGTNGKGSVTAMVDTALRAAGHRSARYTSPHLIDLSERFVIDGQPVDPASLEGTVADIRTVIDRLRSSGHLLVQPTFFEVTTAVAFELFRRAKVDVAVCEVGLGGRLDATNVLQPMATAITSIARDHEQYLGHSLRDIAREKAGIIKPGIPVVVGPMPGEARDEIDRIAGERAAPVVAVPDDPPSEWTAASRVRLRTQTKDYGDVALNLRGAHQAVNAHVAVRLLEIIDQRGLGVPAAAVVQGLERVTWPGRLDLRHLPDGREVLLDAAHNPAGAAALAAFLSASRWDKPPVVFAAMRDKDASGMLEALASVAGAFVFTRASTPRSADPNDLATTLTRIAPAVPSVVIADPQAALMSAWRMAPRVVAAGSIFLLGDLLKALEHP